MELAAIREALHAHPANQPAQSAIEQVAAIVVQEVESLSPAPAETAESA